MAREDFEGQEGGGGIADFDFTVTNAWFGVAPGLVEGGYSHDSGNEIIMLHLEGTTDLEDRPVLLEDSFHPSWKMKDGWEVRDGGKSVEYVGDGKATFASYYGRFNSAVLSLTEHVAETPQDPLAGDNHPSQASIWIGTRWHLDNELIKWSNGTEKEHLMPTAYLGKGDGTVAPAPAAGAPADSANLRGQLIELAKTTDSYEVWQPQALQALSGTSDSALLMEVADRSIWDEANA